MHGGILADPTDPDHQADMASYGIEAIDLVVVNLYPFGRLDFEHGPRSRLIDIGGPAMIRAAAKNHAYVGVVTDPADYDEVLDELRADGALSPTPPAAAWPATAFAPTAAYDAAIVDWFDAAGSTRDGLPADAAPRAPSASR